MDKTVFPFYLLVFLSEITRTLNLLLHVAFATPPPLGGLPNSAAIRITAKRKKDRLLEQDLAQCLTRELPEIVPLNLVLAHSFLGDGHEHFLLVGVGGRGHFQPLLLAPCLPSSAKLLGPSPALTC